MDTKTSHTSYSEYYSSSEGHGFDFYLSTIRRMSSRYAERRSSRASIATTVLPDYETSERNRDLPPLPPMPPLPRPYLLTTSNATATQKKTSGRETSAASTPARPSRSEPKRPETGSLSAPPCGVSPEIIDISRETVELTRARTLHTVRSVPAIRTIMHSESRMTLSSTVSLSSNMTDSTVVTSSPLTPLRLDRSEPPAYIPPTPPTPFSASAIRYAFWTQPFNRMILVPLTAAPETQPLYGISVAMNCFNPLVHVTTIRRGGDENGEVVGNFEMGISSKPGKTRFRGRQFLIKDVLEAQHHNGYRNNGWLWDLKRPGTPGLVWTFVASSEKAICRLNDKQRTVVAEYKVPEPDLNGNVDFAVRPELEVERHVGQKYLDDILMSIMVIERRRSIPSDINFKRATNI